MKRPGKRTTSASLTGSSTHRGGGACPQQPSSSDEEREDEPRVSKVPEVPSDAYLETVGNAMDEWSSKEDETAWRDL